MTIEDVINNASKCDDFNVPYLSILISNSICKCEHLFNSYTSIFASNASRITNFIWIKMPFDLKVDVLKWGMLDTEVSGMIQTFSRFNLEKVINEYNEMIKFHNEH